MAKKYRDDIEVAAAVVWFYVTIDDAL